MQKKSLSLIVLFLLSTLPLIGAEKDEETEACKSYMKFLGELGAAGSMERAGWVLEKYQQKEREEFERKRQLSEMEAHFERVTKPMIEEFLKPTFKELYLLKRAQIWAIEHFLDKNHYSESGEHHALNETNLEDLLKKTNSPQTPFYHKTLLLFKEKLTEEKEKGNPLTNEIIETLFKKCAAKQYRINYNLIIPPNK